MNINKQLHKAGGGENTTNIANANGAKRGSVKVVTT